MLIPVYISKRGVSAHGPEGQAICGDYYPEEAERRIEVVVSEGTAQQIADLVYAAVVKEGNLEEKKNPSELIICPDLPEIERRGIRLAVHGCGLGTAVENPEDYPGIYVEGFGRLGSPMVSTAMLNLEVQSVSLEGIWCLLASMTIPVGWLPKTEMQLFSQKGLQLRRRAQELLGAWVML